MARPATRSLFTPELIAPAFREAVRKLNPRDLVRNPVMFTTACVAALLTLLLGLGQDGLALGFKLQLVVWLWLTVLFGTFAEALAEGRGKAQAASLRATKAELTAQRVRRFFVADDHLCDARGIAQIDEGDATVIATTIDPAREGDGLTDVLGSKGAGLVGAQHFLDPPE